MGSSRERTFISTGQLPHRSARAGFSDPGVAKGIQVTEFDTNLTLTLKIPDPPNGQGQP